MKSERDGQTHREREGGVAREGGTERRKTER